MFDEEVERKTVKKERIKKKRARREIRKVE